MLKIPSPPRRCTVALLLFALGSASCLATPRVRDLGQLDPSLESAFTQAQAVSDDGMTVVGISKIPGIGSQAERQDIFRAFRWTARNGMQNLGHFTGGGQQSAAQAISADGRVVVGSSDGQLPGGEYFGSHALRWSQDDGLSDLGTLPGGKESAAAGVSGDGRVIVGYSHNLQQQQRAVVWRPGQAAQALGTLGGLTSVASHVSRDGTTVVGSSQTSTRQHHAFIWTEAAGMRDLGILPGLKTSMATAASANGQVVVGFSADSSTPMASDEQTSKAFIWRQSSGLIKEISNTHGGRLAVATGVSADGRIVVGVTTNPEGVPSAFRWTQETGMKIESSLHPTHVMEFAKGISGNGRFSVGRLELNDHGYLADWN